jgi:hypothetical protein
MTWKAVARGAAAAILGGRGETHEAGAEERVIRILGGKYGASSRSCLLNDAYEKSEDISGDRLPCLFRKFVADGEGSMDNALRSRRSVYSETRGTTFEYSLL